MTKTEKEQKTTSVTIPLTKTQLKELQALSEHNNRSMNGQVYHWIKTEREQQKRDFGGKDE